VPAESAVPVAADEGPTPFGEPRGADAPKLSPSKPTSRPAPVKPAVPVKPAAPAKPAVSPTPIPDTPEDPATTAACQAARQEAKAELDAQDWRAVLQATRDAACWAKASERARMRVRAFANLRRFEECVEVASKSSDDVVRRQADACRKQIEKQGNPP
jgi:hypothetical protein